MASAKALIVIRKPISEVFEYTASAENGPAFIPNLNENTNITPEKAGVDQTFDWRFNMAGADLRGKAEGIAFEVDKKVTLRLTGDVNATWDYTFDDLGDGTTRITTEILYEIEPTVLQKVVNAALLDRINQNTIEQMFDNLKLILESDD
ncbi:SRPBCC family protein [Agreia pratensis]|uniref:Polyketide cyclase / dehydrase and lipid transport n=1 Tax=Agreia pratensis TaxID=150121 RepID=A0A1X7JS54_9MICO|nr:SRPBCC family protein [Agreia pratensis]MBF4635430.1 SRPBCC family protein [Agreia pratensis]SMG30952.1 Polyketide cyclase / dehydrase and lipid transport [Agreia pratensis]